MQLLPRNDGGGSCDTFLVLQNGAFKLFIACEHIRFCIQVTRHCLDPFARLLCVHADVEHVVGEGGAET